MVNQKMHASKHYSQMSKLLSMGIGLVIYGAVICVDLPNKTWKQLSFGLAFACFVGAFMASESERFADEILSDEEDVLAQVQLDSTFENNRPKNLKPSTTVQISPEHDFPTIPFTWG